MNRLALGLLLGLVISAQARVAFAADHDSALVEVCVDQTNSSILGDSLACKSYLLGVVSGISMGLVLYPHTFGNSVGICAPDHATLGELIAVIKKYVGDHPEQWHQSSVDIVGLSLISAFPCQRS